MCKHGHDLDVTARLRTLADGRVKRECRRCEAARKAKGTRFYDAHPRALRAGGGANHPWLAAIRTALGAYGALAYAKA